MWAAVWGVGVGKGEAVSMAEGGWGMGRLGGRVRGAQAGLAVQGIAPQHLSEAM